jgi:hypothetical protein
MSLRTDRPIADAMLLLAGRTVAGLFDKPKNPLMDSLLGRVPQREPALGEVLMGPHALQAAVGAATWPLLGELFPGTGSVRSRAEWNAWLEHRQKPASPTEEQILERARRNVVDAIRGSEGLSGRLVRVEPQGSYFNNTNGRTFADVDLRVVDPGIFIEYAPEVAPAVADQAFGYYSVGLTNSQILQWLRAELVTILSDKFKTGVKPGKKAIKIEGITGSRADVDVVPCMNYHEIVSVAGQYNVRKGIILLSTEGKLTVNFPDQHHANGVLKRDRTAHRFKRIVRCFKHMGEEMVEHGVLAANAPSFLIECLVYLVDDREFLFDTDDLYGRAWRVARHMQQLLNNPYGIAHLTEINEIKLLFGDHQPWTLATAQEFANAAVSHLGNLR